MDNKKGIWIIVYLFSISMIVASCGSGAGTTNSTNQTGSPSDIFAELPDCSSPPANSVYLCKNNSMSTDDIIAVDVHINSDTPVFGAAFDLILDRFSIEIARKDDQSIDFLPPDPPQGYSQMWKRLFVALNEDTLIVGASRGKELGPITGDIPIVTLKFKKPNSKSPLYFANNSILDKTGQPLAIPADRWYGGYLTGGI